MKTMDRYSVDKLEEVSKILKAIAHPVKLEILQILGEGKEVDVTTICNMLGSDCQISMLSHHLSKMKDNGVIVSNKQGKQVFYSLADDHILNLFDCINNCSILK